MRRTFLFQTIAGFAFVFGGTRSFAADTDAILGDWHLLAPADDEVHVPQHRMDLRFKSVSGQLLGAILNRNNGAEIPLAISEFDGATLRFQMTAAGRNTQTGMPTMVMTMKSGKFEGAWTTVAGQQIGPLLKLVRATK